MHRPVATKDPSAVEAEVQTSYLAAFPQGDRQFVPRIFGWATDYFTGRHPGYLPIDAKYHDFEHTLQGTLCLARLLHGRQRSGVQPGLTQRWFELGLLAVLLHDTGYLKRTGDAGGTGAKYTSAHVRRGIDFAGELLKQKGFAPEEVTAVQNLIRCTGVDTPLGKIPFRSDLEKITGFAVASADLLGQLAAEDYVDKLPALYAEFVEAAQHDHTGQGRAGLFSNPEELMQKTPLFWEKHVRPRLENDFGGLYRFLNDPYPDGRNDYLERIEANVERLRQELAQG